MKTVYLSQLECCLTLYSGCFICKLGKIYVRCTLYTIKHREAHIRHHWMFMEITPNTLVNHFANNKHSKRTLKTTTTKQITINKPQYCHAKWLLIAKLRITNTTSVHKIRDFFSSVRIRTTLLRARKVLCNYNNCFEKNCTSCSRLQCDTYKLYFFLRIVKRSSTRVKEDYGNGAQFKTRI